MLAFTRSVIFSASRTARGGRAARPLLPHRSETINHRIDRQHDSETVVHRKADRTHLEDHTALGNQHPLDPMRLRTRQTNNVTHHNDASGNLLDQHAPRVGRRRTRGDCPTNGVSGLTR
jgi:hypothetical protein